MVEAPFDWNMKFEEEVGRIQVRSATFSAVISDPYSMLSSLLRTHIAREVEWWSMAQWDSSICDAPCMWGDEYNSPNLAYGRSDHLRVLL